MLTAVKVRIDPAPEQGLTLVKWFGCAWWCWKFPLNACVRHYEKTVQRLKLATTRRGFPNLKKIIVASKIECYSSIIQCVAINLNKAYKNFFEIRVQFPRFKSKHHK